METDPASTGKLIVASNRGPVSWSQADDGSWTPSRGAGGLIVALGGALQERPGTWVSVALEDGDRAMSAAHDGQAFTADTGQGRFTLRLVDVSSELPELRRRAGLSTWRVWYRAQWQASWDELQARFPRKCPPFESLFPPTADEAREMKLGRCMRLLPHDNDGSAAWLNMVVPSPLGRARARLLHVSLPRGRLAPGSATPPGAEGLECPS